MRLQFWDNSLMNKTIVFKDLGKIEFKDAWKIQEDCMQELIARKKKNRSLPTEQQEAVQHYLFFCEHPHVYTLGRNGNEAHLLLDDEALKKNQATFHKINRGGDITYHGQGQLVVYPILDLDDFFTDIARYIRFLEEMVIRLLHIYGIKGERIEGLSGVWIDAEGIRPRKICAVGVHLSRWVTMHGIALNLNTDLSYFNHIVPCGISDKAVTSLSEEIGTRVDESLVKKQMISIFEDLFGAKIN